MEEIIGDEEL